MPRIESEGPAAPALPGRHTFTSIYLGLFLLDGLVGLVVGTMTLLGRFDEARYADLLIPFSLALLMGALIQVSLSFRHQMRWSARLIGLYVLGYWVLEVGIGFVASVVLVVLRGPEAIQPGQPILPDVLAGTLSVAINIVQVLLGIWAARDLRRGHYLG